MNRQLIYSTKKLIPQEKKIDPGIKTYLPVAEKQKLSCHHETLPLPLFLNVRTLTVIESYRLKINI